MKKVFFTMLFLVVTLTLIWFQMVKIKELKAENNRVTHNNTVLLSDIKHYKTKDSLNAVQTEQLELTNKELSKWLAEEKEAAEKLNIKNRELTRLLSIASNTQVTIEVPVHDTTYVRDSIIINARCFSYNDNYLSIDGCVTEETFIGDIHLTDTLCITESIKRKRFLGFLWKTNKIKDTKWDVATRCPYTDFLDFQVVKVIY